MKVTIILLSLVALSAAHWEHSEHPEYSERPEFECANEYIDYNLDDEPAEYGVSAGYYAPDKRVYLGITLYQGSMLNAGRVQLDPPGLLVPTLTGPGTFVTDKDLMWFLKRSHHHRYRWVEYQRDSPVPFVVDFGTDSSGIATGFGRIRRNNLTFVGSVDIVLNTFHAVDENGISITLYEGFEILTCKSYRMEDPIPLPAPPASAFEPNVDSPTGCAHTWAPYNDDDAPAQNGVAAGEFDCGNVAYLGRAITLLEQPARVQIVHEKGVYTLFKGEDKKVANSSYLVDNPAYTYRWVKTTGESVAPPNAVLIRTPETNFKFGFARVKVNGHVRIGVLTPPIAMFVPDEGVNAETYANFEILVCDPWPRYRCSQQWKAFDAATIASDGLSIDGGVTFIGRGRRKCINGCDYGIGPATAAGGVNFLDDLTAQPVTGDNSAEYLVANAGDSYKWQASCNGEQVLNALELHSEGHKPFYIGMTRISERSFIGKVRPGEGLFFVDASGRQKSTNCYTVLTCTSAEASLGLSKKQRETDWFGRFGCPLRMEWSFIKWRCVCRDEFRGLFAPSGATWNEQTCSYGSV